MIFQRLKNLWELSAYQMNGYPVGKDNAPVFIKSFPTVEKKLATIIQNDSRTVLERETEENANSG